MRKQYVIVVTGVLFLAGAANASIGWAQNFSVGAINQVEWLGGIGSAASINKASFDQRQQFGNTFTNQSAFQRSTGTLFQNASASGLIGPSTSRQAGTVNGAQSLATNGAGFPEARGQQSLEGRFTNLVVKPEGVGRVEGIQHYVGNQEQGVTTPFGSGTQSQSAEVLQRGSINTGIDTDPIITSSVNLQLTQSQITSGL